MIFKKEFLIPEKLERITTKRKRVYKTPAGTFPSVTTVLSKYFSSEALDKWRQKVGHEEAEHISNKAKLQGNAVHKLIENYLLNIETTTPIMPIYKHLFFKVKPFIDNNITTLYGVEFPIYSIELQTAGTIDLIAEYKNRWKIITDFKTSSRLLDKNGEILYKYKIQAATYAMMIKERYNIDISYGVVVVTIPEEIKPQIFTFRIKDHVKQVKEIFEWAYEYME